PPPEHATTTDIYTLSLHDALPILDSIIEETNGQPLMVAYWWRHDGERLKKRYPYARFINTQKDEDDWNSGKVPMILCQYQSVGRSEEHTSELQSRENLVCRLLFEK